MYNKNIYVLDISMVKVLGYENANIIKSNIVYLLRNIFGVITDVNFYLNKYPDKKLLDVLWSIMIPISNINYIFIESIEIVNDEIYIISKGLGCTE